MGNRYDTRAAIILAAIDNRGHVTSVRRYKRDETEALERNIVALRRAGVAMRLTFLDCVNSNDDIEPDERRRVLRLANKNQS